MGRMRVRQPRPSVGGGHMTRHVTLMGVGLETPLAALMLIRGAVQ